MPATDAPDDAAPPIETPSQTSQETPIAAERDDTAPTVEAAEGEAASPQLPMTELAGQRATWRSRATAIGIDVVPGAIVIAATSIIAACLPVGGLWWWLASAVAALAFLATAANRVLAPVLTGWSLGRAWSRIQVVRSGPAGEPVGVARLLLRDAAHLLDTLPLGAGWWWAARDTRRRTVADILTDTEVVAVESPAAPANIGERIGAVFVGAAALSVIAAAAGFLLIYHREQAIDAARAQVLRQGPKIVADMLSYEPATLDQDFAHAQTLATPKYREQLVPQQDAIRKGHPVPNDYRVTDAAVQTATAHRVVLLMFLQGQRGESTQSRLLSATVRVTFAESHGQWQVDDLSVVTRPSPGEGES